MYSSASAAESAQPHSISTAVPRFLNANPTALIEEGKLRPVVDRTYPLTDVAAALRQVEEGHTRGKIVITIP